ncbi:MAG: hypothetical protein ABWZ25_17640 [Chitinophagaceae bacterium]
MTDFDDIKLENYEGEDISDVIGKLEKSFELKFSKTAFAEARTFGDICDIVGLHINHIHKDGCTKQQAFYKIRKAIAETQLIDEKQISLASNLVELFPWHNRRQKSKEFRNRLGIKVSILTYPGWLSLLFGIGSLLSLGAFFIDWKIAVAGIIFFASAFRIADWLGKDLELQTVRQLVEKVTREHYVAIRRTKHTVNRKEILDTIKDAFSNDLAIDWVHLTREASLG